MKRIFFRSFRKATALVIVAAVLSSNYLLVREAAAADANSHANDDVDADAASVLLSKALAYRFGTNGAEKNPSRAAMYFQMATRSPEDVEDKAVLRDILYEYSDFLENYPSFVKSVSSFELLTWAADEGHPTAQFKLSTVYATGVYMGELVPMDAGRALYLNYMSALSGLPEASMAMGFRYLHGVGVIESCESALPFYELAADQAAEFVHREGHATGALTRLGNHKSVAKNEVTQELVDYYAHLSEQGDGAAALALGQVYMMGSRLISRDVNEAARLLTVAADLDNAMGKGMLGYLVASEMVRRAKDTAFNEGRINDIEFYPDTMVLNKLMGRPQRIVEWLEFSSQFGDVYGSLGLGLVYLHGEEIFISSSIPMNRTRAKELFRQHLTAHMDAGYYLGNMMMETFTGTGHPDMNMYVSYEKEIFNNQFSIGEKQPSAQKEMLAVAVHSYSISSQLGNVLSQHKLSHMTMLGLGIPKSCTSAVMGFKAVAERGSWMSQLAYAEKMLNNGQNAAALFRYSQYAVIGYEVAQFNAAYMLSQSRGRHHSSNTFCPPLQSPPSQQYLNHSFSTVLAPRLDSHEHSSAAGEKTEVVYANKASYLHPSSWKSFFDSDGATSDSAATSQSRNKGKRVEIEDRRSAEKRSVECDSRALTLFALSASQGNDKANLLLGDFYYYGYAGLKPNARAAAERYKKAADYSHNPHALFNLGVLHMGATPTDLFAGLRRRHAFAAGSLGQNMIPLDSIVGNPAGDVVSDRGSGSSADYSEDWEEMDEGTDEHQVMVDFHLAKRYFDQAAAFDSAAELPRDIALALLRTEQRILEMFSSRGFFGQLYEAHGLSAYERMEYHFDVLSDWNQKVLELVDAAVDMYHSATASLGSEYATDTIRLPTTAIRPGLSIVRNVMVKLGFKTAEPTEAQLPLTLGSELVAVVFLVALSAAVQRLRDARRRRAAAEILRWDVARLDQDGAR